ncbi:MAG: hypothetical protein ACLUNV_08100 [Sutterella wadsworthensis]
MPPAMTAGGKTCAARARNHHVVNLAPADGVRIGREHGGCGSGLRPPRRRS